MTREQHLQWAKDRAMEYLDHGDQTNAVASMSSDLTKHDELKDHVAIGLGLQILMSGELDKRKLITQWIQGFR